MAENVPVETLDAPRAEGDVPVESQDAPWVEGDVPVESRDAPRAGRYVPVESLDTPRAEGEAPVESQDSPREEGEVSIEPQDAPRAEGEVSVEPQDAPRAEGVNIDSLHLIFARDLITYVMRRKVPDWTFNAQYAYHCPATPFSYRIRHAVDFHLNKECINFDTLFHIAFMGYSYSNDSFVKVVKLAVDSAFHHVNSYTDLLRLLFLLCHFTVKASLHGIRLAPYNSLMTFQMLLATYIHRKGEEPEYFYGNVGHKAQGLIHENKPIYFHNLLD